MPTIQEALDFWAEAAERLATCDCYVCVEGDRSAECKVCKGVGKFVDFNLFQASLMGGVVRGAYLRLEDGDFDGVGQVLAWGNAMMDRALQHAAAATTPDELEATMEKLSAALEPGPSPKGESLAGAMTPEELEELGVT